MPIPSLTTQDFKDARARMGAHVHRTPLLTSRTLSERTGFDVRLKAELFQRTGLVQDPRAAQQVHLPHRRGEARAASICSSAGNHAQGVALAARIHGIKAVVCMAANATPSKIAATRGYGAEVVLHGIDLGRGQREGEAARRRAGLHLHPSVRRPAAHRGAGHGRPRDRPGLARRGRRRRPDRRRRADLRRRDGGEERQPEGPRHRRRVVGRAGHEAQRGRRPCSSRSTAWTASSTACA